MSSSSKRAEAVGSGWMIAVDQAWRTPRVRREFEHSTGEPPLGIGEVVERADRQAGRTARYRDAFALWVTRRDGLEDVAPASIKDRLEE